MKLTKLDKRMKGYGEFTHYIEYSRPQALDFIKCRNWCWSQWGPSSELDLWWGRVPNEKWCWIMDDWRLRIYLRTEAEAQWFLLKWK
jgi:hypothetical protein